METAVCAEGSVVEDTRYSAWITKRVLSVDLQTALSHAAVMSSKRPPGMHGRLRDLRALPQNSES
ncbi:hypothetical protein E2C01_078539 [Portunus trituberculatus]|uniref:Uncharacterized protein n=1 Tax=Portunus trituberculatus TaxID=210409 RepID=A0A5B7IH67_PORTR|nr:hypothetical protein [Portunus trituberculatus]